MHTALCGDSTIPSHTRPTSRSFVLLLVRLRLTPQASVLGSDLSTALHLISHLTPTHASQVIMNPPLGQSPSPLAEARGVA